MNNDLPTNCPLLAKVVVCYMDHFNCMLPLFSLHSLSLLSLQMLIAFMSDSPPQAHPSSHLLLYLSLLSLCCPVQNDQIGRLVSVSIHIWVDF